MKLYLSKILIHMKDAKLLIKHFYTPALVIYVLTGVFTLWAIIAQCQEPIQNSRLFMRFMSVILFCIVGVKATGSYTRWRKKKQHFNNLKSPTNRSNIKK